MAVITRTTNLFSAIEAPVELATNSMGTRRTLDLRNRDGAYIHCMMGRTSTADALTRSAFVAIRKTFNDTLDVPNTQYDSISQTALAIRTTLSGNITIGDTTCTVLSATSLAIGDVVCLSLSGARVEWFRIFQISGTTITPERPFRLAHTSGDNFCTLGDVQTIWVPGGDQYAVRCTNQSGKPIVFRVDAEIETGSTFT